ncbi:MAG: hypothetical protein GWN09_03735 [Gammaproteobacteria bacterium]|nr:hypothetical protein [Gammaproteobacteria bacterium]
MSGPRSEWLADSSGELLDELLEALESPLAAVDKEKREETKDQIDNLRNFLSKIKEHGQRADRIVKSMLVHAREGEDTASSTDLNVLIEETLNLAYHGARAENESFNVSLQRDLDPRVGEVQLYPQAFTRVVLNLLNNSFYATYERKTQSNDTDYSPTVKVSTRDLGGEVEARVWDNGTGIPQATVEKIFDPFYTSKPTGEGTGLGLSMSYETVVQQHHGRFEVDTKEGEYTEFIITLPRQAAQASRAGGAA